MNVRSISGRELLEGLKNGTIGTTDFNDPDFEIGDGYGLVFDYEPRSNNDESAKGTVLTDVFDDECSGVITNFTEAEGEFDYRIVVDSLAICGVDEKYILKSKRGRIEDGIVTRSSHFGKYESEKSFTPSNFRLAEY